MRFERIQDILQSHFPNLSHLELEDESHKHSGRAKQESHFKILLVSKEFTGLGRLERQRTINELLRREFQSGLHAVSMRLVTPSEFRAQSQKWPSPDCQG